MPRDYEKKTKLWTAASLETAMEEVSAGASVNSTAAKYHMSEGTLRRHIKFQSEGKSVGSQGRKSFLPSDQENHIAFCIREMAAVGFPPTLRFIRDTVADYLINREISIGQFKDGIPGEDWVKSFMTRHNLNLKKPTAMSLARYSATANPFVIYEFYHMLDAKIKELGLEDKPSHVWNCDESGFPSDPSRCKVGAGRGQPAVRVTTGCNRENTTILAVVNAAGEALDPLILFKGKNIQSTWKGEKALPDTWYGITESGWMTADVFYEWFCSFAAKIQQRPLLLLFDGHLTHVTIPLIEKAMAEDITIIKLPPHTSELLQPLDRSCFGPLKGYWEGVLVDWIHKFGPNEVIRKAQFVNLLATIWRIGLSPTNIISGFGATGVFPVDGTKYPSNRLKQELVKRYRDWVAAGRPSEEPCEEDDGTDAADALMMPAVNAPSTPDVDVPDTVDAGFTVSGPPTPPRMDEPSTSAYPQDRATEHTDALAQSFDKDDPITPTAASAPCSHCAIGKALGPIPCAPPPGRRWIPVWTLSPIDVSSSATPGSTDFQSAILSRMKGPTPRGNRATRRKIDMHGRVITESKFLQQLRQKTKKPPSKRPRPPPARTASTPAQSDDSDEEYIPSPQKEHRVTTTMDDIDATNQRLRMDATLARVTSDLDSSKRGQYYAVYYNQRYYWGQLLDLPAPDTARLAFMRYKVDGFYDFPVKRDVEVKSTNTLFFGPVTPSEAVQGKGIRFAEDNKVALRYNWLKKAAYYD